MLPLILGGAAALFFIATPKKNNTTLAATPRGTQTGSINVVPQTTKSPSSATPARANQGAKNPNANQPWYTGPVVAGAGLALTAGAKALAGIFSSAGDDGDEYDSASEEIESDVEDVPDDFSVDTNTDSEFYDVDPDAGQYDYYADDSEGDDSWGDD